MSRWNLIWLLAVPAAVFLGLAVTASAPPPDKDYQLVRTVVDVLAEVDRSYVRELSDEEKRKLVEDMINGGLSKLDPYSEYFNEEELKAFETQSEGQYGGVGIVLQRDGKVPFLRVESPLPGSPAYDAGIQAGDIILKVGDVSTENMQITEARKLIKGPPGTKVTLTIAREGMTKPEDITLTRAIVELHPVMGVRRDPADPTKWEFMVDPANKIALIRLLGFTEKSDKELKAAVEQVEREGAQALILDMRDNPGGLLSQAALIADLFLTEGTIVSTQDRRGGGRNWSAKEAGTIFEPAARRPMAVLVNRASASASEIVAAALQDLKRAAVIGERSYGKGSVQKVIDLNTTTRKAAVKLTTEKWLTPAGKNIHRWPDAKESDEWGVRPDTGLEVKITEEDRRQHALHIRSLDVIKGKPGLVKDAPPMPEAVPAKPYKDPVVEKALEHLRGKIREVGELPRDARFNERGV